MLDDVDPGSENRIWLYLFFIILTVSGVWRLFFAETPKFEPVVQETVDPVSFDVHRLEGPELMEIPRVSDPR